jgi:hypothetical protein
MNYPIGTLDLDKIQDTIYDWIFGITQGTLKPEQIIWRNQSEPLPPRPCVTLKFTYGPAPIARDANVLGGGLSPDTAGMQQEATLSVQTYGSTKIQRPKAMQLAIDLNSSLLLRDVRMQLNRGGVSVQAVGKPSNMTALEETEYEERAGFELSLGMVQNITDPTDTIEVINLRKIIDEVETDQQITLP